MLEEQDLNSLSQLSHALWADKVQSMQALSEVVSGVALCGLSASRSLEKASSALLMRANQQGCRATLSRVADPFYRLSAEQRFILSSLHKGRWSYSRIARILKWDIEEIAEVAWSTRLHLAFMPASRFKGMHPSGSARSSLNCPEYAGKVPWTQKFLDDESTILERVFLQDHLGSCDMCRNSLIRCRTLYYFVDGLIPRFAEEENRFRSEELRQIYRKMWLHQHPSERTFLESLKALWLSP